MDGLINQMPIGSDRALRFQIAIPTHIRALSDGYRTFQRPDYGGDGEPPRGIFPDENREGVDTLIVELDMEYLRSVRQRMPVMEHRRRDLFG